MVPDESVVINGEIKTALVKLKETKEKRWSIIKQKFFEKYEQCPEEEEENGYEKYLAVEETLPAEKVNTLNTNKADRGAWVEQEFIAPELKPYHEEAERLRYDIEDKIKTLNLMVIPNNSTEILPVETDQQDSTILEPSLNDKKACSDSVMKPPKKQVKKKVKKTAVSSSGFNHKGKKTEKLENSNPGTISMDDSSVKVVNKRNVQDEELEEALKKLHENKMRRWAMIKQKFYEKYEKIGENSAESGGNGHRNYESLGQEANLVYISEDLADHHSEANNLRNFIEEKILTLKPYQAKLKSKKKAQQAKECSEETIEKKIVQATLQFHKKCALNGDNIVQNKNVKSPSSRAGKDNSVVMGKVSPSKSPKGNHTINRTSSSPSRLSPKKIAINSKSPNNKKSQNASKPSMLHKFVKKASKSSGDTNSEPQDSAFYSDGQVSTSHFESNSSVSAQDQNSPGKRSESKPLPKKNLTVLKTSRPSKLHKSVKIASKSSGDTNSEPQASASYSDGQDLTSHFESDSSVSAQKQNSPGKKSESKLTPKKNLTVRKFQKRQSVKNSKSIVDSEEMTEIDSESVIDCHRNDMHSLTPASNAIQNVSIDQLPFQCTSQNQTSQRKETYESDLDLFAGSSSSEYEIESESDRKTCLEFYKPSPTNHQSIKGSPKIKKHPEKDCLPSTSSSCNNPAIDKLSPERVERTASKPLSDLNPTSLKDNSKVSSSALKKRKYKPSKDRNTSETEETITFDSILDSTPVRLNLSESSTPNKRKCKDWRTNNLPSKQTNRFSKPSDNLSLQNLQLDQLVTHNSILSSREEKSYCSSSPSRKSPSFRKRSHHHSSKTPIFSTVPVDELVKPPS